MERNERNKFKIANFILHNLSSSSVAVHGKEYTFFKNRLAVDLYQNHL